ncbi:MAG: aminoacyl-histidine dipeptidase [Clostridiales bacterium]|jgi:dipeptidase D|nr:aminoacyl-histidine dipeptidase [Clostridiales bacterium]
MVLKHFYEISKIPRGSGNEKAVSDYIAEFARARGAKVVRDDWNNLIITKPASAGCADKPPVILQAHMDMVCEKNAGTQHDFLRDALQLYEDGDFIKARGTTLGADNGIGVAFCMALLEEKCVHPPLEIVLTTDEETGMSGAQNLDVSQLKGTRMLNLDSSDETTFTMGCAAGTTAEFLIPADWANNSEMCTCEISVRGLKGGHSGGDIEKERGNALRILAFLLNALNKKIGINIAEISGGMKINAIPREASATIVFAKPNAEKISQVIKTERENFLNQFKISDAGLTIDSVIASSTRHDGLLEFLTHDCTQKIISALLLIPTGMISRSFEIDGLVNASCNIGVAETTRGHVKISAMPRGAAEYFTRQIEAQISAVAALVGAEVNFIRRSPAWQYNPDSELMKTAAAAYKKFYNREAVTTAVHGGLECGIFLAKFAERGIALDIVSFGPNAYDYHTPDEKLSISSTNRAWEFLKALMEVL